MTRGSRWALAGLALTLLAASLSTTALAASHRASAASRATFATFAGSWGGHTRSLTISHRKAKESIGDGCCDPIIDLKFRLLRVRGSAMNATARVRVTSVKVHNKQAFTRAHPAPRVGQVGHLRLKGGVITDSLTDTTYCDEEAGMRGVCGA